jgi:hypothetical protein
MAIAGRSYTNTPVISRGSLEDPTDFDSPTKQVVVSSSSNRYFSPGTHHTKRSSKADVIVATATPQPIVVATSSQQFYQFKQCQVITAPQAPVVAPSTATPQPQVVTSSPAQAFYRQTNSQPRQSFIGSALTNNLSGTAGTTLTPGNSGAAGNAFDAISIVSGGTLTYDSLTTGNASGSVQVTTGVTSGTSLAEWISSEGVQRTIYFRIYIFLPAIASPAFRAFTARSGASHAASIVVVNQVLSIAFGSGFSTASTFTTPAPLGQWFRVEGTFVGDPTGGSVSASLYTAAESVVPDETKSATSLNTVGPFTQYWFGQANTSSNSGPFWFAGAGISPFGLLGPLGAANAGEPSNVIAAPAPRGYFDTPKHHLKRSSKADVVVTPPSRPVPVVVSSTGTAYFLPGKHTIRRGKIVTGPQPDTRTALQLGGTVGIPNLLGGTVSVVRAKAGSLTVLSPIAGTLTLKSVDGTATVSPVLAGSAVVVSPYSSSLVEWTMQEVDIVLAEFNDETVNLAITSSGSALNITGYTLEMYLKPLRGSADTATGVVKLSTATGEITITNAPGGLATVAIPATDFTSVNDIYTFYRVDTIDTNSKRNTAIFGLVTVTQL